MSRPLAELADIIQAQLIGEPAALIEQAQPFDLAGPDSITLASDIGYLTRLEVSAAAAFIVPVKLPPDFNLPEGKNYLVSPRPKLAFARAVQLLHSKPRQATGISQQAVIGDATIIGAAPSIYPLAVIGRECRLGERVTIHSGAVIGDGVTIGDDTTIYANVSVYENCRIGKRVIIHSGAVIGADGFGFVPDEQGNQVKLLQIGQVIIEDDVELGANVCVDRAAFGATILRRGVKLDNAVHVAHNCELRENTVVAAQVGFSGSAIVGRNAIIAGQAATNDGVVIGDGAIVGGQAGVTKDVPAGKFVAGTPAQDHRQWKKSQVLTARLPELFERLKELEKKVKP